MCALYPVSLVVSAKDNLISVKGWNQQTQADWLKAERSPRSPRAIRKEGPEKVGNKSMSNSSPWSIMDWIEPALKYKKKDNGSILEILMTPAFVQLKQRRVAKLHSEVNQAEEFMVEDAWYESGKQIMPEAAIYLQNSVDPHQPARLPIPQEMSSLILFSWSLPNLIWKTVFGNQTRLIHNRTGHHQSRNSIHFNRKTMKKEVILNLAQCLAQNRY